MAGPLDEAFVEIIPDFRRFNREVRSGLGRANVVIERLVGRSMERVEQRVAAVGANIGGTASRSFRLFSGAAEQASRDAVQAVDNAADNIKDSLRDGIGDGAESARDSIQDIGDESRTTFQGVGDDAEDAGERISGASERAERNGVRAFSRLRDSVNRLGTSLSNLGRSLFTIEGRFITVASLITVAVVAAIGAAEELGGLFATLPALAAVAGAGIATLSVVTHGLGDAFAAAFGDAEEFAEATENLAPSARGVVEEFRALVPLMQRIGRLVQEAAFEQLDGALTAVAENLAGPIQQGMTRAASSLGALALEVAEFGAQAETARTVTLAFLALDSILRGLEGAIQPFLEGLRILADEFLPVIINAEGPIASIGERFRDWAEAVTESGEAMEAAERALGFLGDTFDLVGSVGDLLAASFDAASDAGVNLIETITELIDDAIELAETPQGQAGIARFFQSVDRLLRALLPVIGAAAVAIGRLIDPLADLIEALAPGAKAAFEGIADGLIAMVDSGGRDFVEALSDALIILSPHLETVGEAIGGLLRAVSPLLAPLATLIGLLLQIASSVIVAFTPLIELVATALSSFFTPFLEVMLQIAQTALPPLAEAFGQLAEAMTPFIEELGQQFAEFLMATLPPTLEIVTQLIGFLTDNIDVLVGWWEFWLDIMTRVYEWILEQVVPVIRDELWPVIRDDLIPAIQDLWVVIRDELLPALQDLWDELKELVAVIIDEVDPEMSNFEFLAGLLRAAIRFLIGAVKAFTTGLRFLIDVLRPVIEFIRTMTRVVRSLRLGLHKTNGVLRNAWRGIKNIIDRGLRLVSVLNDIRGMAGRAASAISSIPDIPSFGTSIFDFFAHGGIVRGPTQAVIGESGPEVVIPLSRPQRARDLVQQSGLFDIIGLGGLAGAAAQRGAVSRAAEERTPTITLESGAVRIEFLGATPDESQARRVGNAAAQGLMDTLAARQAALAVKRL